MNRAILIKRGDQSVAVYIDHIVWLAATGDNGGQTRIYLVNGNSLVVDVDLTSLVVLIDQTANAPFEAAKVAK